jgi:signal peptidase I
VTVVQWLARSYSLAMLGFAGLSLTGILVASDAPASRFNLVFEVASSSMEPTLHCAYGPGCHGLVADRILVNPSAFERRAPHPGELIVLRPPSGAHACSRGTLVKRVIGSSGWTSGKNSLAAAGDGEVSSGEPYSSQRDVRRRHLVFVAGDNRGSSCDSRTFGLISRADIVGRVEAIYWPPERVRRF